MRAMGSRLSSLTISSLITTTKAAPSEVCEAFPAVTCPPCLNRATACLPRTTMYALLVLLPLAFADPVAVTIGKVDWTATPQKVASTASTVEVDVMPFLGRTPEGGPFDAYFEALSNLGSEYVRYAPWYPYPRVVVTELEPPDCTATKPGPPENASLPVLCADLAVELTDALETSQPRIGTQCSSTL